MSEWWEVNDSTDELIIRDPIDVIQPETFVVETESVSRQKHTIGRKIWIGCISVANAVTVALGISAILSGLMFEGMVVACLAIAAMFCVVEVIYADKP